MKFVWINYENDIYKEETHNVYIQEFLIYVLNIVNVHNTKKGLSMVKIEESKIFSIQNCFKKILKSFFYYKIF